MYRKREREIDICRERELCLRDGMPSLAMSISPLLRAGLILPELIGSEMSINNVLAEAMNLIAKSSFILLASYQL